MQLNFTLDISEKLANAIKRQHDSEILDRLDQIIRRLQNMVTQEQLDGIAETVTERFTNIEAAIKTESAQIKEYIASHQNDLDIGKLEGAVKNLSNLETDVGDIFTPPEAPAPEPAPE